MGPFSYFALFFGGVPGGQNQFFSNLFPISGRRLKTYSVARQRHCNTSGYCARTRARIQRIRAAKVGGRIKVAGDSHSFSVTFWYLFRGRENSRTNMDKESPVRMILLAFQEIMWARAGGGGGNTSEKIPSKRHEDLNFQFSCSWSLITTCHHFWSPFCPSLFASPPVLCMMF